MSALLSVVPSLGGGTKNSAHIGTVDMYLGYVSGANTESSLPEVQYSEIGTKITFFLKPSVSKTLSLDWFVRLFVIFDRFYVI